MPEPVSLQALDQAVRAQSKLLAEMLASMQEDEDRPAVWTRDQAHEALDYALGELPDTVRRTYFHELDRLFPHHSTEE